MIKHRKNIVSIYAIALCLKQLSLRFQPRSVVILLLSLDNRQMSQLVITAHISYLKFNAKENSFSNTSKCAIYFRKFYKIKYGNKECKKGQAYTFCNDSRTTGYYYYYYGMDTFLEWKIVVGRRRFTSVHRTVGEEEEDRNYHGGTR